MDNFIFDERIKDKWTIDKTLAFRLHNKDSTALEEFYTLNEKHLLSIGYVVVKECKLVDCYDVVNGVIVDIFNYDFSDLKKFKNCLSRSIYNTRTLYTNYSLRRKSLLSLEKLKEDNNEDKSCALGYVYIDNSEDVKESELSVINFLKSQIKLTLRQKDDLLCKAFGIQFFKGAFNYYAKLYV